MNGNWDEYRKSMQLVKMVASMSPEDKIRASEAVKEADIARLMRGTTVQKELKRIRGTHSGKVKTFLSALSECKFAQSGVDVLFNKGVKV